LRTATRSAHADMKSAVVRLNCLGLAECCSHATSSRVDQRRRASGAFGLDEQQVLVGDHSHPLLSLPTPARTARTRVAISRRKSHLLCRCMAKTIRAGAPSSTPPDPPGAGAQLDRPASRRGEARFEVPLDSFLYLDTHRGQIARSGTRPAEERLPVVVKVLEDGWNIGSAMKPIDIPSMITFCAGCFSAVGPPLIRRSRSAGSFLMRSSVVRADTPAKIVRYTQACQ
jgi:hypothetical protein